MKTAADPVTIPPEPLLAMHGIRKSFGGVEVLKEVDFDVRAGEVHALCGENGAGKSTLMNILAGVLPADAGRIMLAGESFAGFAGAHAAQRHGIAMVFQERSLFSSLTVAENIFVGRQPATAWGVIDRNRLRESTSALLRGIVPEVAPDNRVAELTPAQQQMVEIAKAVSLEAKVMVFDEPTAALTATETMRLFAVIKQLQARGVGIVYISHRLEEVFHLCDRVTVLKDGVRQCTLRVAETTGDELVRRMVGRDVVMPDTADAATLGPVLLEVRNVCDPFTSNPASVFLRNVSLRVRAGEIVGLAGLNGAGRTETALSLFGVRNRGAGAVSVAGKPVQIASPGDAIAAGLGYMSEDRKELGLFLEMSVSRNISVANLRRFGSWWMRGGQERRIADSFRERLGLVCRDVEQATGSLSGGNQQKVLLARWLLVEPRVLMVDEPTRGVDVGAKSEMHRLLREYVKQGHAVLMISSDLPEVLTVCDRVYVMRAGQITGELARENLTEEAVMRLANLATSHDEGRSA